MSADSAGFRAVILDLFGVVIDFDEDLVYRRIAQHCTDANQAFIALQGTVSRRDLILGELSLPQLHDELAKAHGLGLSLAEFEKAWNRPYSSAMPGMAALIERLSKRYRLVLLSKVDRDYWQGLRGRHPELECFAAFRLSWETGVAKPDRGAFLGAIEATRSSASQCFFVDDKTENIEAARSLGLPGHRFSNTDDLRVVLEREGIHCA